MSYPMNARGARRGRWRSGGHALVAVLAGALVAVGMPGAVRAQALSGLLEADTLGTLVGTLVGRDDGQPIAYATVTLERVGRTIFAGVGGTFRFGQLAPGRYPLRARQIGYAPLDTSIVVTPGPDATTISLSMRRIAVRLAGIGIVGQREKGCVPTGVPDSTVNPTLATLFSQVRENVDRFRLLLDEYPFRFDREERRTVRLEPGGDSMPAVDTVTYESRARRPYSVGGIIYYDYDATGRQRRYMYLPTFRDLADPAFLTTHCFTYGGAEVPAAGGAPALVRVDFRPANRIKAPDVEGSIYLDSQRFIVRRAVFAMTRPQAAKPPIIGLSVTTTFRELVPLVPVFDSVQANETLPIGHRSRADLSFRGDEEEAVKRTAVEDDRILNFTFEDRTPGDEGPTKRAAPSGDLSSKQLSVAPSVPTSPRTTVAAGAPEVTGRVLQTDGTPVLAATVGLFGGSDTALTSDSGAFTLTASSRGAHMLWVRRLGFVPARVPVNAAVNPSRAITITLNRLIPTLATVTTTAAARSAMKEIGLDRRMRAGQGQFLTYDQIERRHATKVSELLRGMRGIRVFQEQFQFESSVVGTRGVGSCVAFAVDGVPQSAVNDHDIDNMVDVSGVAAIEVYSSAERPLGMGGLEEHPLLDPHQPPPAIDTAGQQCMLVVIWTRGKLGLPDAPEGNTSVVGVEAHARAVFPNAALCEPRPPDDTIDVALYASLAADRPGHVPDTAWSRYTHGVLDAIRSAFTMPSDLPLAAFSQPFQLTAAAGGQSADVKGSSMLTAPGFWSVIAFALDSAGHVVSDRVAASSLSGVGDTAVLAAIADADAAHAFPAAVSPAGHAPTRSDLILSTGQPLAGDRVTTLGRVSVPVWALRRRVALADSTQPNLAPEHAAARDATVMSADSALLEFVVSDRGTIAMPTVRVLGGSTGAVGDSHHGFLGRLEQSLPKFRYDPALIGACPVPQIIVQPFMWRQF